MANAWFDIIDALPVEQLKKDMAGRTLVGEYIGSQDHQHLVMYSRVTIIFYAVVENLSEETCWPCEQAWALFAKYGLDVVKIQDLGTYKNYGTFCDQMETTFKDVAKSPIAQDEEGNVLYFIDKSNQKVLSLAKLKTLEYRLFRKMREKLRGFYSSEKKGETVNVLEKSKEKFDSIAKKFRNESEAFLDGGKNQLPQPLEYYETVFKGAFDYIKENPSAVNELHNQYVTFSENLLKFIKEKNQSDVALNNFFYSDVLDK